MLMLCDHSTQQVISYVNICIEYRKSVKIDHSLHNSIITIIYYGISKAPTKLNKSQKENINKIAGHVVKKKRIFLHQKNIFIRIILYIIQL